MERMEQLYIDNRNFIVVGRICSGKSTFSTILKKNIELSGREVILTDVGDVVRKLMKREKRVFDASLDQLIAEEINESLQNMSENTTSIIVGLRQKSILDKLNINNNNTQYIFLDSESEKRKVRFGERNSVKDKGLSFEEIEEKEDELGLSELIQFIQEKEKCETIKI